MGIRSKLSPPDYDQIEVTLIGPGFGECVIIHIGNNSWIIVDSCIDNNTRKPAALSYLKELGINPKDAVKLIGATHWHDDHIRGLNSIVTTCPNAEFWCSMAFTQDEFIHGISGAINNHSCVRGSGVSELLNIILSKYKTGIIRAVGNKLLKRFNENELSQTCEIWSLSPSDEEIAICLEGLTKLFPEINKPKKRIRSTSPNNASVVLWINIGDISIFLGGDLENTNDKRGWTAIVNSNEKPNGKASIFKLPHHGSQNGHHDQVWQSMLTSSPFAILTPYNRTPLPSEEDTKRICSLTDNAFITSNLKRKSNIKRSSVVEKTIREAGVKIQVSESPTGIIQLRHKKMKNEWEIKLINSACHLSEVYT